MHERCHSTIPVVLAGSIALAGCEGLSLGPTTDLLPATEEPHAFIHTDRTTYEASFGEIQIGDELIWYIEFELPLLYTNRSSVAVHFSTCNGVNPPRLERVLDGAWNVAYQPPHLACFGPPIRVDPGETLDYVFKVRGYDPGSDVRPVWIPGQRGGNFRINWWPVIRRADDPSTPMKLEESVSNTFEVQAQFP
jgi:hypothetical protein